MTDNFYILGGWIIDGTGGPILSRSLIEISNGIIVAIRPMPLRVETKVRVVDLSHCSLIPGLVDSHVHLCLSGKKDSRAPKNHSNSPSQKDEALIAKNLKNHHSHGIVAVRDGGDPYGLVVRLRGQGPMKQSTPVRFKAPGKAWHAPGRYGGMIGRPPMNGQTLAQSIEKAHHKMDHVKIVNSGLNSLEIFGKETPPQFDRGTLRKAVDRANDFGLKCMVHANGRKAVEYALEAGCRSIEHGFFMGEENLHRMADMGTTWVPTAFTMKAYTQLLPPGSRESDVAKKNCDHQLEQIRKARRIGVPIAVGTDSGSPGVNHGQALGEELKLLLEAGYRLEEGIQCATSRGAELLEWGHLVGKIKLGMPATMVAFPCPPEVLMDEFQNPEGLFIGGKRFY